MLNKSFIELNSILKKNNFNEFEKKFIEFENKSLLCEKCYNLFGLYLVKKKDFINSAQYFQKAISLNSNSIEAMVNLALINLRYLKNQITAKNLLKNVINLDPDNKNAQLLLFEILYKEENFTDCINICNNMIDAYPAEKEVYNNLGLTYYKLNNFELAILNFKKAIQLDSKNITLYFNLYQIYKQSRDYDNAEKTLYFIIKKFPQNNAANFELSAFYRGLGEFQKSDDALEKVLKMNPDEPKAIYELLCSPHYQSQQKLFEKTIFDYETKTQAYQEKVGYGLFKYLDRSNDIKKAAYYLKKSLDLTNKRLQYNFEYELEQFKFIKDTFNSIFIKEKYGLNLKNPAKVSNIFIVGLHRSGSTLLEQMLTTNNNFASLGELTTFPDLISQYYPNQELNVFKSAILSTSKELFFKIGNDYLKKINCNSKTGVDKQLSNFKLVGFIMLCLPSALIIDIKREKGENLFSILSNFYADDHAPWSYNENNLARYHSEYVKLMNYWKELFPSKIVTIQYEKLVENPEKELSKILKHFNLNWNESFLNFRSNKNLVQTQSVFQIREKLYTDKINNWKKYCDYFPDIFN